MSSMSLKVTHPQVTSGKQVRITGYYKYLKHLQENRDDCFIPEQAEKMLFKEGTKAPMLGSCPHDVVWELILRL